MPTSAKLKTNTTKSYQMRLTITPKIHEQIIKARKKYKFLDDNEIVKIFIGHGVDFDDLNEQNTNSDEDDFTAQSQHNFTDDSYANEIEDFSKLYKKTTGKKLKWI